MKNVVYIADIDQDIDDMVAIEYLERKGYLKYIVLDSEAKTELEEERIKELENNGVLIEEKIKEGEEIIFVGGSLKKVREFLNDKAENKIKTLIINGGFVGDNVIKENRQLKKFKGETFVRTYNFNLDVESTDFVLKSEKIEKIFLIGKNVCHSEKNTMKGIWKEFELLKKYQLGIKKRLHDLLMVDEGLKIINGKEKESYLKYEKVKVIKKEEEQGKNTKWGSELSEESNIIAAIDW